jgi:hypothetical protein
VRSARKLVTFMHPRSRVTGVSYVSTPSTIHHEKERLALAARIDLAARPNPSTPVNRRPPKCCIALRMVTTVLRLVADPSVRTSAAASVFACSQKGYLSSRGGYQNRWHSLVSCDHGDSTTSRFDSPWCAPPRWPPPAPRPAAAAAPPRAPPPAARAPPPAAPSALPVRAVASQYF